jgi:release factor glutamine methyltransferase
MKTTIQYIEKELAGLYPKTEVKALVRLILEHVCGLDFTAQVTMRDYTIEPHFRELISAVVARLKDYEPIQYIIGETEFFGLKLKVTPAVLIPRPETEELVHWIAALSFPVAPGILDIGSGSGCIALSLKKQFGEARVSALDCSVPALENAKENAILNGLDVHFFHADILKWEEYNWGQYDLMVSNPPYVSVSEKEVMLPNVLKYEPGEALFVSDSDPLLFYHRIAGFAQHHLNENGWLFFEINEKFGQEITQLLKKTAFREIKIKKDLFGKVRMVRCRK